MPADDGSKNYTISFLNFEDLTNFRDAVHDHLIPPGIFISQIHRNDGGLTR